MLSLWHAGLRAMISPEHQERAESGRYIPGNRRSQFEQFIAAATQAKPFNALDTFLGVGSFQPFEDTLDELRVVKGPPARAATATVSN
jgi:hypothetical protein